jgi:hypothetical protein
MQPRIPVLMQLSVLTGHVTESYLMPETVIQEADNYRVRSPIRYEYKCSLPHTVLYLKLAELHQVNSRFSILWIIFNISISTKKIEPELKKSQHRKLETCHYYATTYEIQSSSRFNSGRNCSFPMFIV